ncbi:THAP domain-containing protein 2-like isoform X2 [Galleria mellonella]|uniref:THAP domain-containing protein 2-like isoform X2 n=1 Tax=Galleria mellonella TaxID=7137 RepID=A0A6J3C7B5_GALME|nr:THAP domain-containing protein 2-like isoform X2 [Galleria mellonella]
MFPKDQRLCSRWVSNMGLKNWKPTKTCVLCSKHFEKHYIDKSIFRTRLRPGAVPTLFETLPESSEMKKKKRMQRKSDTTGECVSILHNLQNIEPQLSTLQQKSVSRNTVVQNLCKLDNKVTTPNVACDTCINGLKREIVFKNKIIKSLRDKNKILTKRIAYFYKVIIVLQNKKLKDRDIPILNNLGFYK